MKLQKTAAPPKKSRSPGFYEIATLLHWEGQVTNARLRQVMGVTNVYASQLLAAYRQAHPKSMKRVGHGLYHLVEQGKGLLQKADLGRYLDLVDEQPLVVERVRPNQPVCDPKVFRALHSACRDATGVTVTLAKLSAPEGVRYLLYPHALVEIHGQWWVRAYSDADQAFRLFDLGGFTRPVGIQAPAPKRGDEDFDWHTEVDVRVTAHSALSGPQREMIEARYFGGTAGLRLPIRGPLIKVIVKGMAAATDPSAQLPPSYVLEVANREKLGPWL